MTDFVELTDENFEKTIHGVKSGIIDYYATWCGACRMAAPMFKRVATELGQQLFKIDAEKNPEARSAVKIDNLPTIAVVRDGKIVGSLCTTKEEGLKEFLAQHGIGR